AVATIQNIVLPGDLITNGAFYIFKRVKVFDLAARSQHFSALWFQRNVSITAKGTFFHITITDLKVTNQRPKTLKIFDRMTSIVNDRVRDDFDKRSARSV